MNIDRFNCLSIDAQFDYLMELCKADLAKGKQINYTCPYCGIPLAGLFEKGRRDDDDDEEKIFCPCCGQHGAF